MHYEEIYEGIDSAAVGSARMLYDPSTGTKKCTAVSRDPTRYTCQTLNMGAASGLVAVDIDKPVNRRRDPADFFEKFRDELEATLVQVTARDDGSNAGYHRHYIFHLPEDPNSLCHNTNIGVDNTSVDLISTGSVIFAEPCCLAPDMCYRWQDGFDLSKVKKMSPELEKAVCIKTRSKKAQLDELWGGDSSGESGP